MSDEPGDPPIETTEASRPGGSDVSETPPEKKPALRPDGMERPRFVLDFPDDPALAALSRAFEEGNYAVVRRDADAVARAATDPAVRDAALELRHRIEPDPMVKYLLGLAFALLVFLTIWAYRQ